MSSGKRRDAALLQLCKLFLSKNCVCATRETERETEGKGEGARQIYNRRRRPQSAGTHKARRMWTPGYLGSFLYPHLSSLPSQQGGQTAINALDCIQWGLRLWVTGCGRLYANLAFVFSWPPSSVSPPSPILCSTSNLHKFSCFCAINYNCFN